MSNDIPITQQQFLGASIRSFSSNLGWGEEPSMIEVSLVEDDKLDEFFDPVFPGYLTRFQYNNWVFDGILDNYEISRSDSGNRTIKVTITDPRRILEGVQLILDGYNDGVYNVPNLYNIFGYLESFRYGNSEVNEFGIPAYKIIQAFDALMIQTPMIFQGVPYYLSFNTSFVDRNFRISSSDISVMELITQICDNYNRDFFVTATGNTMYVTTIDRNLISYFGAITQILNESSNYNSASVGAELQKSTSSRFIVGGQVEGVYFRYNDNYQYDRKDMTLKEFYDNKYKSEFSDNIIHPYWGLDNNNNVVIGQGTDDTHWFILNGKGLIYEGIDFRNGYPCDTGELRAALVSFDHWMSYLETFNKKSADDDPDEEEDEETPRERSESRGVGAIQKGKFSLIGGASLNNQEIISFIKKNPDKKNSLLAKDFLRIAPEAALNASERKLDILNKIYEFVKKVATEHYGRKFMVQVPNVLTKYDELNLEIDTSLEPVDSGYITLEEEKSATRSKLLPRYRDFVKDDEGKIVCYVRFDNVADIDLTALSEDDFYVEDQAVYIKCSIDKKLVFLDRIRGTSPRAVITLPAPVFPKNSQVEDNSGAIYKLLVKKNDENDTAYRLGIPGNNAATIFSTPLPFTPVLAAIPLRNNYKTYGPWYIDNGGAGLCEFEKNDDLVPWKFSSVEEMNLVANSLLYGVGINSSMQENGSITLPGIPATSLGGQLIDGGPYVSSIQVSMDASDGILTTYKMQRWANKIGKQNEQIVNQRRKLQKTINDRRRMVRKLYKSKKQLNKYGDPISTIGVHPALAPRSPHHMIFGEIVDQNDKKTASVVTVPFHDMNLYFDPDNLENRAGMSIDGLFRPFSTNYDASGIPHFVRPSASVSSGLSTSENLNPFTSGDIGVLLHGNKDDTDLNYNNDFLNDKVISSDNIRPLGLRAPVILVGYGRDINGKPVPNEDPDNPTDQYVENYKFRQDLWKAGPLDAAWDESRGVWVAGGANIMIGQTSGSIPYIPGYDDIIQAGGSGIVYAIDSLDNRTPMVVLNRTNIHLKGMVRIENVVGFSLPLISPYSWGTCT